MENKHVNVTTRGFGLLFRFTPGQSRFGPGGNLCREYHVSHWCLGLKETWKTILRTIQNGLFFFEVVNSDQRATEILHLCSYFANFEMSRMFECMQCRLKALETSHVPTKKRIDITDWTAWSASWNLRCLFFQEVLHESQLANHIRVDSSYPCAEQWLPTHGHFQCISVLFFIPSRNSYSSNTFFRMPHEAWDLTPYSSYSNPLDGWTTKNLT